MTWGVLPTSRKRSETLRQAQGRSWAPQILFPVSETWASRLKERYFPRNFILLISSNRSRMRFSIPSLVGW
jgi:hypothetical protein